MAELDTIRQHRAVFLANQSFYAAFESLDIRNMAGVWLQEDWVQCIHPGWPRLVGWPAVRDSWVRIFNNTRSMTFTIEEPRVTVYGAMAMIVCVERIGLLIDDAPQETQILATNIFVRTPAADEGGHDGPSEEGRWLMVHHHGSPVFHRPAEHGEEGTSEEK